MKSLVIIQRMFDDFPQPVCLGAVHTDMSHEAVADLWWKWLEEVPEPDSDLMFIDWLIKNHGCDAVANDGWDIFTVGE